jgi:Rrf2 family protein
MLSLTRKTGYGLIALAALARLDDEAVLSAHQMAEATGASRSLLMKVLKQLASSGYVESTRGARGGYRLGRPAEQINLAELVSELEGPLKLAECVISRRGDDVMCNLVERCPIADPIQRVHAKLNEVLSSYTLADLLAAPAPAGGDRERRFDHG